MKLGEGITMIEVRCDICKEQPMSEQVCINRVWKGVCKSCSEKQKENNNAQSNRSNSS